MTRDQQTKIRVVGIDSNGPKPWQQPLMQDAALLVGAKRLLAIYGTAQDRPMVEIVPLAHSCAAIQEALRVGDVVVLASGDPLFFGIGRRLMAEFGTARVEFQPGLSALQEAASLFKLPWDDAALFSLHGRQHDHIPGLLLPQAKAFILTDQENSPQRLAAKLLAYLRLIGADTTPYQLLVVENIGNERQRVVSGGLAEIAEQDFARLNIMCLLGPGAQRANNLGLEEDHIQHSRGLITKDEVRAITLHKLRLPRQGVFWDVGAGSGSIAIEAARLNPGLTIYAIERKAAELVNIKANIRRFACFNIVPVAGMAGEVLGQLPVPQRVFVGGNGGQLAEIIRQSGQRLGPGGRLVVNGVIAPTIAAAPDLLRQQGLRVSMTKVEINRTGENGQEVTLNPITIMVGSK